MSRKPGISRRMKKKMQLGFLFGQEGNFQGILYNSCHMWGLGAVFQGTWKQKALYPIRNLKKSKLKKGKKKKGKKKIDKFKGIRF